MLLRPPNRRRCSSTIHCVPPSHSNASISHRHTSKIIFPTARYMRKILRRIFAQLVTLPPTIGLRINESGCRKNSFEAPHHGHETEDGISGKRRKGSAWWWGTDRDDESNEDFSSLRWQTWELPVVRRDGWTIRAAIYQIERENPAMDPSRGFRHWKKAKRRRTRRWKWGGDERRGKASSRPWTKGRTTICNYVSFYPIPS